MKAELGHGAFVPWMQANLEVTPRQAQRYMAAALGKAIPIRVIKSDTGVAIANGTDLLSQWKQEATATSWIHRVEELGLTPRHGAFLFAGPNEVIVEPCVERGWFYVVKLLDAGRSIEHFGRPMTLAGVAVALDLLGAQDQPRAPLRLPDGEDRFWASFARESEPRHSAAQAMGLLA